MKVVTTKANPKRHFGNTIVSHLYSRRLVHNSNVMNLHKSSLLFFFLLIVFQGFSQNLKPIAALVENQKGQTNSFEAKALFVQTEAPQAQKLVAPTLSKSTFLELDRAALRNLYAEKPQTMTISLLVDGSKLDVELVNVPNITSDFKVQTDASGGKSVDYKPGGYYRGIVAGDNESVAGFSIFENEIIGMVSSSKYGNIILAKMETGIAKDVYMTYLDRDFTSKPPFSCGSDDMALPATGNVHTQTPSSEALVDKCVRVYLECDYALYQNKGTVANTTNYITAVFNNLAALYQNESIFTTISTVFVWTSLDTYSRASSSTALNEFKAARPTYNGDLAHLAALGGNGLGGVAWLFNGSPYTVLCSTYGYAYSNISSTYNSVPTYSWTVEVMTHEMGHNLGSNHTQWCGWTGGALDNCYTTEGGCAAGPAPTNGGTIMSYCHLSSTGINFANGFGAQPGDRIRTAVTSVSCIAAGTCTTVACNAPTTPSLASITTTGATVSWSAVSGATSYTLEYKTNAAATWTIVTGITTTSRALTGLTSATLYNVRLKTVCSATSSSAYSTTTNFTTATPPCNAPTTPSVASITTTGATVSWSAVSGATSYTLEYKTNAAATWTVITGITTTSRALTGLTASTLYNVRLKTVCSATSSSAYSTTTNFTTATPPCNAPTTPSVASITTTGATVSWSAVSGATSYTLEYKTNAAATWTIVTGITTTSRALTGLTSATLYNVRLKTVCSATSSSAYSTTTNFTTATPPCNAPTTPSVASITTTGANRFLVSGFGRNKLYFGVQN